MSEQSLADGAAIGPAAVKRSQQKRSLILDTAMRHFAEHGYEAARVGDMADHLGIAKGSVFQHFGSKDGLFFEAYKSALRSLPPYLDVPAEISDTGFFVVVRYRLSLANEFLEKRSRPYSIVLLGNYGSDLSLKKRTFALLRARTRWGRLRLYKWASIGEIRTDVDQSLIRSMLECTFEHMHDFLLTAEVDPELFHRVSISNGTREQIIDQFVTVLRGAIGTPARG
jgi:AcrR family transcriptional regulator